MTKIPFVFGIFLISFGCAHQYNLPANRFDSPEASGKLGSAKVELPGVQTGPQMVIKPDEGTSDGTDLIAFQLNPILGMRIGLSDRIDGNVRLQANGPLLFRFKFQAFGEPETSAKKGNFSASITSALGFTMVSQAAAISSETATPDKLNATLYSADVGLVAGYRFSPLFLLYGGAAYGYFSYSGSIKSGSSFSGNATMPAFFLGTQYNKAGLFLNVEVAKATASAGSKEAGSYYPGILIGLRL